MVLGERIKRIRTSRGLTQRELGLKLGYEERNASDDKSVRYYDNDDWPATSSSVDEKGKDKKNNSYK